MFAGNLQHRIKALAKFSNPHPRAPLRIAKSLATSIAPPDGFELLQGKFFINEAVSSASKI
jgi:hypothetical protein